MKVRRTYVSDRFSQPHITLIPPFCPKNGLEKLTTDLVQVIHKFTSLEIKLDYFDIFKGSSQKQGGNVLFIAVRDDGRLSGLQIKIFEAIQNSITNLMPKYPSVFHITVLKRMDFPKISDALRELKKVKIDDVFKVQEIVLFAKEADEPWQVKARLPLR